MKISIHQPGYWPWLGLLNKIAQSDKFIILDNVEISKGTFQYRNQFLCNGSPKFITLPIEFHSKYLLCDLKFNNENWKKHQLSFIENYYKKADYFDEIFPVVERLYAQYVSASASGFINNTMIQCLDFFGIRVDIEKASDFSFSQNKGELVLEICKYFEADVYISGQGAKAYMDDTLMDKFIETGIQIEWQSFVHPKYNQGDKAVSFVEGLSSLDVLFHNGIEKSREIFRLTLEK